MPCVTTSAPRAVDPQLIAHLRVVAQRAEHQPSPARIAEHRLHVVPHRAPVVIANDARHAGRALGNRIEDPVGNVDVVRAQLRH
jgi:hypothetical protein